jgi:hypothetical protein
MVDMMVKILTRGAGYGIAALVLVVVAATASAPAAQAPRTQLAEHQQIDESLGAFDDPVLVRMRTRVPPTWRGPRAEPPVTERRNCPRSQVGELLILNIPVPVFVVPGFC